MLMVVLNETLFVRNRSLPLFPTMKCFDFLRYILLILLAIAICWFTYLSFDKLFQEDTTIGIHYTEAHVELPSVTLCVKWLSIKGSGANASESTHKRVFSLPPSDNWTFSEFMDRSFFARNVIDAALFSDQLRDKKTM